MTQSQKVSFILYSFLSNQLYNTLITKQIMLFGNNNFVYDIDFISWQLDRN